jgi:DNA invertase Pin-like site-specific DNA recombinase
LTTDQTPVPAAQYLRVSTERQEYSLDFQSAKIAEYAQQHGFVVTRTYCDEAKSGLAIRNRKGLRQLLQDVTAKEPPFRAVLVYDVSRWGRFQDPDESAYYEYICKSAGVFVHYCAEHFSNDGYLPHLVLKALKRVMTGEYSRELSEKVFAGMVRLARDGYRPGARAGYGLRRLLVAADGRPKMQLEAGERKSTSNERVVLVVGPAEEVHWVQEIYRMFVHDERTFTSIADKLNRLGVPFEDGKRWNQHAIRRMLTNPKYNGTLVYNRRTSKLGTPQRPTPRSDWVVLPGAIEPIVDQPTFDAAQQLVRRKHSYLSDEERLEALRVVLNKEGMLSRKLIKNAPGCLSPDGYRWRFGSLVKAFELAGYDSPRDETAYSRTEIQRLRKELMQQLVRMFPGEVSIVSRGPIQRDYLRVRNGTRIAVRACRCEIMALRGQTWIVQRAKRERQLVALMAGMDRENRAFEVFYVLPAMGPKGQIHVSADSQWLRQGVQLTDLRSFCEAVHSVRHDKEPRRSGSSPKGRLSPEGRANIAAAQRIRWTRWKKE